VTAGRDVTCRRDVTVLRDQHHPVPLPVRDVTARTTRRPAPATPSSPIRVPASSRTPPPAVRLPPLRGPPRAPPSPPQSHPLPCCAPRHHPSLLRRAWRRRPRRLQSSRSPRRRRPAQPGPFPHHDRPRLSPPARTAVVRGGRTSADKRRRAGGGGRGRKKGTGAGSGGWGAEAGAGGGGWGNLGSELLHVRERLLERRRRRRRPAQRQHHLLTSLPSPFGQAQRSLPGPPGATPSQRQRARC
jgi:hypothetical protein